MTSGIRLALEAIAHDVSLLAEDPEVPEVESLLVQTQQVWETAEAGMQWPAARTPEGIERLLTGARQSLSNGDAGMAIEELRDAVAVLRQRVFAPAGAGTGDVE